MASKSFEQDVHTAEVAIDLEQWFDQVLSLLDDSLFGGATDGPHVNALFLDLIGRNGRTLNSSQPDSRGELYTPICLLLAVLTRHLGLSIRREHWKAAVENVLAVSSHRAAKELSGKMGLALGTPATVFRGLTCEALRNAGMLSEPTILDEANRKLALGVALNRSLRLLLAYALEATAYESQGSERQDLAWLRQEVEGLLPAA